MEKPVKIFLKEGDLVAHKENLQLRIEVRRILRSKKPAKDGVPERRWIDGIECGWWENGDYKKEKFHTNSLVPWHIAEKGYLAVMQYCDQIANVKAV